MVITRLNSAPRRNEAGRIHIGVLSLSGLVIITLLLAVLILLREPTPPATSETLDESRSVPTTVAGNMPAVQVVKPTRQDLSRTLTIPANVSPWYQATLYAKVPGYLKSIAVDKGDLVKEGQLLAVIEAPEIQQQYAEAEAQYAIKRLTFQRLSGVWKQNPDVIAKQDVDVAEAEAKAAKHLMDRRQVLLDYTRVYAPFAGVITGRFADPGALIQAATSSATQAAPLVTIMQIERVRVYASVPQEVAHYAKPGTSAVVSMKEIPGKEFRATISRTTSALDPSTRTLLVEIDLPNPGRVFQPGMFAAATLFLEPRPNALTVPSSAIVMKPGSQQRAALTVVDGKIRTRLITTGLDDGTIVEVLSGLEETDSVVVVGKGGLVDGTAVVATAFRLPVGMPARQKS